MAGATGGAGSPAGGQVILLAVGLGYLALLVGVWCLGRAQRRNQERTVIEFFGGPKDGERVVWAGDQFTVVTVRPVALSPWGRAEREEEEGPWVVQRVGVYQRQGDRMVWVPE